MAKREVVRLRFEEADPPAFLRRLQAGGPEAGALLFDAFEESVNRLVWRLLGADTEHDDVVHDVFCSLLAGVGRVREPAALNGWVRAVTANTVRSVLRRRRLTRLLGLGSSEADPDRFEGVCDDVDGRRLVSEVYSILDGLPADLRVVFVLRHFEQLTLPEVASAAGCSLATAKRRLKRARNRFARAAASVDGLAERLQASPVFGGEP